MNDVLKLSIAIQFLLPFRIKLVSVQINWGGRLLAVGNLPTVPHIRDSEDGLTVNVSVPIDDSPGIAMV